MCVRKPIQAIFTCVANIYIEQTFDIYYTRSRPQFNIILKLIDVWKGLRNSSAFQKKKPTVLALFPKYFVIFLKSH